MRIEIIPELQSDVWLQIGIDIIAENASEEVKARALIEQLDDISGPLDAGFIWRNVLARRWLLRIDIVEPDYATLKKVTKRLGLKCYAKVTTRLGKEFYVIAREIGRFLAGA